MKRKKPYMNPQTDIVPIGTASDTMLDIPIYSQNEGIEVGAKEQTFDLDDWPSDPWEDHVWEQEGKADVWEE